jgi:catechol 2,3-dioxygenase-like lactoylglutathione lyase family enzyme
MDQRLSLITLGVSDLVRARAFYEALGWHTNAGYSAAFRDPDGHPWEVAPNPRWTIGEDGAVAI